MHIVHIPFLLVPKDRKRNYFQALILERLFSSKYFNSKEKDLNRKWNYSGSTIFKICSSETEEIFLSLLPNSASKKWKIENSGVPNLDLKRNIPLFFLVSENNRRKEKQTFLPTIFKICRSKEMFPFPSYKKWMSLLTISKLHPSKELSFSFSSSFQTKGNNEYSFRLFLKSIPQMKIARKRNTSFTFF